MTEKMYVTKEGLENLNKELRRLIEVDRPQVIEDLKDARAQGDLSENADYDTARDQQARVEARIREIEATLDNVEMINEDSNQKHKQVTLGAEVTILDYGLNEEETFNIVGSVEADPVNGKLSNVSPLAKAMLDHEEGDVVRVDVDEPYEVKILSIK